MKYLKIIIPLAIFALICFEVNNAENSFSEYEDKVLHNNVNIKGVISSVKRSNNHCFAVWKIDNVKSNIAYFRSNTNEQYFPYVIKNKKAEIYLELCDTLVIGDSIELDSNNLLVKITGKNNIERSIGLVTESYNISFIKKNTQFPN
ncbi:hypothetical protein HYN48_13835 [Flavobacterium magnum]|uniref:Uncharacterized protein n=1 Tax=Flavobacterium magnum TaxID=2162713 RepID=A0A2S0RHR4_9FLAO|nr:hypothetical protein [Flavobacterium magnum]AWA30943.1 hypothetical protein HYN48_13135 [Flavobacterium magnum]AWA31079.1 hypothetical protein HYN48_13835 [Flavobacterium magnum]